MKKGFKQTDIGLVPEDWISCRFEDVLDGFSSGMTPYRGNPSFYTGNIPWITSGELNYNIIKDRTEKITKDAVARTNLKIIPKETFLIAVTGLEAAETRGSCAITGIEATTNQSCMALYPKEGKIVTEYLYHFYVCYGDLLAFKYCQGTKQQSYTEKIAKILPINLPPTIKEQRAIAKVLSDVDALIGGLEAQIEKKRRIKQGAMQELLSAKADWEVDEIRNFATIKTDSRNTQDKIEDGKYPFFVRSQTVERINDFYFDREAILTAGDGVGTGKVFHYINGKFDYHQRVYAITNFDNKINGFFFFQYFKNHFYDRIMQMTAKSSVDSVRIEMISKMKIPFPIIEEQTRIATILSDMDAEIEEIEEKYRGLKVGLMQGLLSGRKRLLVNT